MTKQQRSNFKTALTGFMVALSAFVLSYVLGRFGDCKPHEIDGQCGLSTFMGMIFGAASAVIIILATAILVAVRDMRDRSRQERENL